jgi:N-acetylmuramoyl-L-alanine amidase
LAGYWQKIARLNKNPERSAGFKVLKAPDVPSVLLELGYLSSEKDVAALTSPEWRIKAADSVAASINAFFAPRLHDRQTAGAELNSQAADPDKTAVVVLRPHL